MSVVIAKNQRAKEILTLLKAHGPLTSAAIAQMLNPKMMERTLYLALARLKKKAFIDVRVEKIIATRSIYQIAQSKTSARKVSDFLNCSVESIFQPQFRYRELLHNDACALTAYHLQQQFPSAKIIRDFEFTSSSLAQDIMISTDTDRDLKPDLLLYFPQNDEKHSVAIAFEIEKTRKTNARLVSKLKKYASGSHVDGVVYFCDSERIIEALSEGFKKNVISKALRVKHYGNYFLMLSDSSSLLSKASQKVYGLNNCSLILKDWVRLLQNKNLFERRSADIAMRSVT